SATSGLTRWPTPSGWCRPSRLRHGTSASRRRTGPRSPLRPEDTANPTAEESTLSIHTTKPAGRRLHGKSVIVTGAARGQGGSHAGRLASEGPHLLPCDILSADAKATAHRAPPAA